ncbi:hypothetical protein KPL47_09815 [Clostridium estertheticum]|uniref:hypothetical protein n=1 Tax=Clostridium estertheticum TaxID=238834 RepID=UPI001C0C8798|nr:hypothetical protein [Clostridium estertheticum]MBU3176668.1 hypothetical protein [Clostridium estertheticum]
MKPIITGETLEAKAEMEDTSNAFDYLKNFNEEDIARKAKEVRKVKPDSFLGRMFKISNDEE